MAEEGELVNEQVAASRVSEASTFHDFTPAIVAEWPAEEMATLFPSPGPALPPFRSLLVKGNFHATAPLHLCLSHVLQDDSAKAILLTSSRARFIATMKQFNEEWVVEHGGDGRTVNTSRRIDMLCVVSRYWDLGPMLNHAKLSSQPRPPHFPTIFIPRSPL